MLLDVVDGRLRALPGAVTAEDMPQTSLDEALATPQEIEPDPSAGRTPGTRPAGEADGNAVGH